MTVYKFDDPGSLETLADGEEIAFVPGTDGLEFLLSVPGSLLLTRVDGGDPDTDPDDLEIVVRIGAADILGKSVILTDVSPEELATGNFSFPGGTLWIGDNTSDTTADADALEITGTASWDYLMGLGGNDTISALAGNDVIDMSITAGGGYGQDSIDGGDGTDLLYFGATMTAGVSVNLAAGTVSGGAEGSGAVLTGIENVSGTAFADELAGDTANNRIEGLGGDDTLDGGGGKDTLDGGDGTDLLQFEAALLDGVAVDLSEGSFSLAGDLQPGSVSNVEDVRGTAHADVLAGDSLANRLEGQAGDDTLEGGGGADTLDGGAGTDLLLYTAPAAVTVNLATGVAGDGGALAGIENVTASHGDDSLTGDAGANRLEGMDGNDTLTGGGGADTLDGGFGIDRVLLAAAGTVNLATGTASGGVVLSGFEDATGSGSGDWLVGGAGVNDLDGMGGNDTFSGASHSDSFDGGAGSDLAYFAGHVGLFVDLGSGYATSNTVAGSVGLVSIERVTGSANGDIFVSNASAHALDGGAGNDTFTGGGGADTIVGGAGTDLLSFLTSAATTLNLATGTIGGGGRVSSIEVVFGSESGDALTGSSGADRLDGGFGNDTLYGGGGADTLDGGAVERMVGTSGSNVLSGMGGNDSIMGTFAADTLLGGAGSDFLDGGIGRDRLDGGAGNDRLVWDVYSIDALFDGGLGTDTLRLAESGADALNLYSMANGRIRNIEAIDMTGGGRDRLTLGKLDVLDLSSSSQTVTVLGNRGDVVDLKGSFQLASTAGRFETWKLGDAIVKIEAELTVL